MNEPSNNEKMPKRLSETARKWLKARGLDPVLCEEKLGITSGPLPPAGHEWLKLPYERNGELVNYKLRRLDAKEFTQKKGGEQIFWRGDCLKDAALADDPLVITEGEFDAIAAIQAGFWRTVSVPGGAPMKATEEPTASRYAWLEAAMGALEPVREIILAVDSDGPGRALLHDLTEILGAARCKFAAYPFGCKDLNDVLAKHGEEGVRDCLESAPWANVSGVFLLDELPALPDLTIWRAQIDGVGALIPLCPGHISIWTGIAGHGKSTLLNACAWSIAERYGFRIGHGAFETTPQREYLQDLIAHRNGFRATGRDVPAPAIEEARAWAKKHIVFINSEGVTSANGEMIDASLEWFIQCAQTAIIRHNARLIILDPWSQIEHDIDAREREDQYIRRSLRRFKMFAKTFNVHIAIVAHPMKPKRGDDGQYQMPEGYEISGAAHWFNFADVGVTVHRSPEPGNDKRVLVRVWKVKNHRMMNKPGDVYMDLDYATGRYTLSREPYAPSRSRRADLDD